MSKMMVGQFLEAVATSQNGQEAADKLGISRERVRQFCQEHGITKFRRGQKSRKRICPSCGEAKHPGSALCIACYLESHRVTVRCAWCGLLLVKKLWSMRPENRYGYYCNMSHRSLQLHAAGAFKK